MFVIRDQQLAALAVAAKASFIDAVIAAANERYPVICGGRSQPELQALVGAALDKAARHGINESGDRAQFAHLVLAHGLDFERTDALEWAAPLLGNDKLDGAGKVALIFDRLPARLRPGAAAGERQ